MADPSWLADQVANLYAPHVRGINEFVDGLHNPEAGLWAPHVAPHHAHTPTVLSVLRDPGNGAHHATGSGVLCIENDDQTSARQRALFDEVGLTASDLVPWNAYPFYINRAPRAAELDEGARIVNDLLHLPSMSTIRVVLLQGNEAATMWRRATRRHPHLADLHAVVTIHPGWGALRTPDPTERVAREERRRVAYRLVAETARGGHR